MDTNNKSPYRRVGGWPRQGGQSGSVGLDLCTKEHAVLPPSVTGSRFVLAVAGGLAAGAAPATASGGDLRRLLFGVGDLHVVELLRRLGRNDHRRQADDEEFGLCLG
jgi:hypothetical protein